MVVFLLRPGVEIGFPFVVVFVVDSARGSRFVGQLEFSEVVTPGGVVGCVDGAIVVVVA